MRVPTKSTTSEPYFVHRTASSNLPVYLLTKSGGNLKQTIVRKLEGDIAILRDQLREFLKIEKKEDIKINPLTKHVVIKVRSAIWTSHCEANVALPQYRDGGNQT